MLQNNPSSNPGHDLRQAAKRGDLPEVKKCLKKYSDAGVISQIINNTDNLHEGTALKLAVENRHSAIVEVLLTVKGIDVSKGSLKFGSPVHIAAANGMIELVKLLVKAGADLEAVDIAENTALDYALFSKRNAIVVFLIKQGIKLDRVTFSEETSLMRIFAYRDKEAAKLFIRTVLHKNPCQKEPFHEKSMGRYRYPGDWAVWLFQHRDMFQFWDTCKEENRVKVLNDALNVFNTAAEPYRLPPECWRLILDKLPSDSLYGLFYKPTTSSKRQAEESLTENNPPLKRFRS